MGERPAVVVDCDPGQDDAFALLLAAVHCDLVAVTTVHGNAPLEAVTRNALAVLELAGHGSVPVHPGASRPLVGEPLHGLQIHGESGLDGAELPEPTASPSPTPAVDALRAAAAEHDDLTIVAIGPLTNIATALRADPVLADRIGRIHLMGGSASAGNRTPAAEFNILADPEAASAVFTSGIPIRMAGLDLTRQARFGPAEVDRLRDAGGQVAGVCADLLAFYTRSSEARTGQPTAVLHDPCAVAWLVDPTLVEARHLHVEVELHGTLTRGMTVCDTRPGAGRPGRGEPPNAEVGFTLDAERFVDLVVDTVGGLG